MSLHTTRLCMSMLGASVLFPIWQLYYRSQTWYSFRLWEPVSSCVPCSFMTLHRKMPCGQFINRMELWRHETRRAPWQCCREQALLVDRCHHQVISRLGVFCVAPLHSLWPPCEGGHGFWHVSRRCFPAAREVPVICSCGSMWLSCTT